MGMCGNGVMIGMAVIRQRKRLTRLAPLQARTGCAGAGVGATPPVAAGRRTGTGSARRTGATSWGSGPP
jgi:hypothetical protein